MRHFEAQLDAVRAQVEQRQSRKKEFAIDHALAETRGEPKANAWRKRLQHARHGALIMSIDRC